MTTPDVAADKPTSHHGLLGKPTSALRLKVSKGSRHRGQVVDIRRQKCTVGSAAECSLRLLEPGIAPVECLILRGAVGNVVRWLDVRQIVAGGELFHDELLRPGDQFRVGPLQLEVLEDDAEGAPPSASSSDSVMSACLSRLERLEHVLTQQLVAEPVVERSTATIAPPPETSAALAVLTQQMLDLQAHADRQRSQWDADRQMLEGAKADQSRQLQDLQLVLERLQRDLESLRDESQRVLAARDALGAELEQRTRQLTEQAQLWPERQAAWEAERARLVTLVEGQAERLRDVEARLEATTQAQRQSAGTLETWELECRGLRQQLDDAEAQIQNLKQEVERQRQIAVSTESRAHELVLKGVSQAQAATAAASENVREELTRLQTQYECERDRWQAERRILNEDLQAQRQQLEQQQLALLRAPAGPLPEAHRSPPPGAGVAEEPAEEPTATSAAYRPAWAIAEADDSDPMSRFLSRGTLAATLTAEEDSTYGGPSLSAYLPETADDELDRVPPSFTAQTYAEEEPAEGGEAAFPPARKADEPSSTAQILKRLRESHVWSDNPAEATAYRPGSNPLKNDERHTSPKSAPEHDPLALDEPTWKAPASGGSDDDESIEAYMNRLLKRVRVGSQEEDESPRPSPTPADRTPMMEIPAPVIEDEEDEPPQPKISLEEYRPRSAAPEQSRNLHAMRTLANDNTRSAVASHARRNWTSFMKLKLLVSVFAITAIAASMTFFWGNPLLVALGSCVGIAVMFYWVTQARTYRQLLVESMMPDTRATDSAPAARKDQRQAATGE